MMKIANKFLLAGDNIMSELHLRQQGFSYSACGPLTKHCKRIHRFKEIGQLNYIYKSKLEKNL